MPPDTPLNKAHQYASNAEDYINQGYLIPAAEEHYKSAEAFLQCVDQASDEGTKRTLRMLYNEHNKAGKELQRRIAKLREEGKDPSLPQRLPPPSRERSYTSPSPGAHSMSSHVISRDHTIDESYMVLGQQQSDPMDTFNQFWKDLEGMLDNLSQPVAFATAPLARLGAPELTQGPRQRAGISSDDRPVHRERSLGNNEKDLQAGLQKQTGKSLRVSVISKMSDASDPEEVMADEDSPSGESFFMIPSSSGPSLATKLQKENDTLRVQLASLQQRLDIAERMRVEQEEQLRERIVHARREAQRVKNSGFLPPRPTPPTLDLSSLNINVPPIPTFPHMNGNRDREVQLTRRVKELEEEVKEVRIENEKQKAMITKFRERWEKLKESAKRKRNAKANASSGNNVQEQRIDEEPEAEVAAEDGDVPDTFHAG